MSWKESTIVDEKLKFIARHLEGETITELCKEFGVSRTTGHNLIKPLISKILPGNILKPWPVGPVVSF